MNSLSRKSIKLLSLILAVALFSLAAACGGSESEEPRFSSVELPDLSAETIDYYYTGDVEYECFLYKNNGKYGTINETGAVVSEPILDNYYISLIYGDNGDYAKWAVLGAAGDKEYLVSAGGEISPVDPYGIGFEQWCRVYWAGDGPRMFVYGIDDSEELKCDFDTYYGYEFLAINAYLSFPSRGSISHIIPIREVTDIKYENNDGIKTAVPVYKSEKYGLFDFYSKRMLTDFIYDDCSTFAVNGVFAAKKGDKWGYITDTGEELTDFIYETAYKVNEYDSTRIKMFQPVNGYIVVLKDGKYGLIDIGGNKIADCEFDYLSQVNPGGVFFALKDGKWSRCKPIE